MSKKKLEPARHWGLDLKSNWCAAVALSIPFLMPTPGFGLRPSYDRFFTIAMTNLHDANRALDEQMKVLAPTGDGPYVRIGLFGDLPSFTNADPRDNWNLHPNPAASSLTGFFETARKRDVPLIVRVGTGPWLDPIGYGRPNAYSVLKTWRRNIMWFDDNKIHETIPVTMDSLTVWGANDIQKGLKDFKFRLNLSRYNKEVQSLKYNLRRQTAAVVGEFYRRFPHLLAGATLDGELGMDPDRDGHLMDYNPWSILEFRDWATAKGEYAPGGPWAGQAYVQSGRYRLDLTPASDESGDGHTFNGDFGTAFASWDLRYFSQSEFEEVSSGRRNSFSLTEKVKGGFDPPRVYKNLGYTLNFPAFGAAPAGNDRFLKLWNYFRAFQIMYEYDAGIRQLAEAGIPADLIFNWVIPADSWYDRFPSDRAYGSALTTWTARNTSGASAGLSYYGISDSVIPFVKNLGARQWNWTEVPGNRLINDQRMSASVIEKYWRNKMHSMIPLVWCDNCDERIQGHPLEAALRNFISANKSKPWPGQGDPLVAPELTGYSWGFPPVNPDLAGCDIPGYSTANGWLQASLAGGATGNVLLDQKLGGVPFDIQSGEFDTLRISLEANRAGTLELFWNGGTLPLAPIRVGMHSYALSLRKSASWTGKVTGMGLRFKFSEAANLSLFSARIYKARTPPIATRRFPGHRNGAPLRMDVLPERSFDANGRRIEPGHPALFLRLRVPRQPGFSTRKPDSRTNMEEMQ